ncbi:AAA family ATPase [Micromonospora sp. CA-111912]|uniref:AAA family ATPase n=1 Tax=Micromonospora sp. CA-111912 TaxID=3239955 RepID=UPI003D8B3B94
MHQPDLLILDEPTSGLDPLVQQTFLDLVRDAKAAGQTVFMSSHIMTEVEAVSDRVGIIREGHPVALDIVALLRSQAVHRFESHSRTASSGPMWASSPQPSHSWCPSSSPRSTDATSPVGRPAGPSTVSRLGGAGTAG